MWRYLAVAWFNLTYQPGKLLRSLSGIIFAVILMFMFSGFQNALFDSQLQIIKQFNADLILVNARRPSLGIPEVFPADILYQAQQIPQVDRMMPIYFGEAFWKNQITRKVRLVRVIGLHLADFPLNIPEWHQHQADLQVSDTVLVDRLARPDLGPTQVGVVTELADRRVQVVGNFDLGNDFATLNGNVITSSENFLRYFGTTGPAGGNRSLNQVDLGLIQVRANADAHQVAAQLKQYLPKTIAVYTRAELMQWELNYWQTSSNIGFVFNILTIMGFAIGVVLCYQLLYNDISENIRSYATLKAIGYYNRDLSCAVLLQALLIASFGFMPGWGLSQLLYQFAGSATGLIFQMTLNRSLYLFSLTIVMCAFSGLLALIKVQRTNPAEIF
jgi:putative ABC transport system permease protein